MKNFTISRQEEILILTLDQEGEKVNTLNEDMMSDFEGFLDDFENDPDIQGAVLISGKEKNFIAGADIEMFRARDTAKEIEELSREGHRILDRIAALDKPVAVAVHGSCMGGGLELSLACHYRVCSDHSSTVFSLPEVKLGLLPGTGGSQRLPRRIGIQKSLTYMLTGKNLYARQARKTGLMDEVTHKDALITAAVKGIRKLNKGGYSNPDKRSFFEKVLEGNPLGRKIIFSQARKKTAAQTKGNYPAPPAIIDAVEFGYNNGLKAGLENESRLFGELGATRESRNLVNLFFGMNASKKIPDKEKSRQVNTIGVLGAGLMGSGIADVSINKGNYQVLLKDQTLEQAAKGEKEIRKELDKKVSKKILTSFERDQVFSRVTGTDSYKNFSNTDLVIEAVFEDLDLKRSIVQETEKHTPAHCIFASNTSSLPIKDIASAASRPGQVIGMHYFSPVQKMPLLEIITTEHTEDWVTATAVQVGVNQGKNVIVVKDGPGFYTTRILAPYMNEAIRLLDEGASIEFLDRIMKDFGYPVGPMALLDEVGIDVAAHVADTMAPLFNKRGVETHNKAHDLLEKGYEGRKSGKGMYTYPKDKKKQVNTEIYSYFGGSARNNPDAREAQQRMALMMVNEAVWCLQEEIIKNPTDGDLGAILGLGFPPFLGGPFRYADQEGIQEITKRLEAFADELGPRFKPAPLLKEMAESDRTFHS